MMEQELTKFLTFWDHLNENEKRVIKTKCHSSNLC